MILTELCSQGSLRNVLQRIRSMQPSTELVTASSLDWSLKLCLARDVARALTLLHQQNLIHR